MGRRVGRGTPPEGPRDHREAQERGRTGRIFLSPRSADFSDAVERPAARGATPIRRAVGRHAEHSVGSRGAPVGGGLARTPAPGAPGAPSVGSGTPQARSTPSRHLVAAVRSPRSPLCPPLHARPRGHHGKSGSFATAPGVDASEPLMRGRSATVQAKVAVLGKVRGAASRVASSSLARARHTLAARVRASRTHPFERRHGASQRCVPRRGSAPRDGRGSASSGLLGLEVAPRAAAAAASRARAPPLRS